MRTASGNELLFTLDVEDAVRGCIRARPSSLPPGWPIQLELHFDAQRHAARIVPVSSAGPYGEDEVVAASTLVPCLTERLAGVEARNLLDPNRPPQWVKIALSVRAPVRDAPPLRSHRSAVSYVLDETMKACGTYATSTPYVVSFGFQDGKYAWNRPAPGPQPSPAGILCIDRVIGALDLSSFAAGRKRATLVVPFFLREPLYTFPVD